MRAEIVAPVVRDANGNLGVNRPVAPPGKRYEFRGFWYGKHSEAVGVVFRLVDEPAVEVGILQAL